MEIVTDHYKWRASGAAFDTPLLEVCYGGDSPLGNRDPELICIKIQALHHRIHGEPQSVSHQFFEQFDSRGNNLSRQLMTLIHTDRQKR